MYQQFSIQYPELKSKSNSSFGYLCCCLFLVGKVSLDLAWLWLYIEFRCWMLDYSDMSVFGLFAPQQENKIFIWNSFPLNINGFINNEVTANILTFTHFILAKNSTQMLNFWMKHDLNINFWCCVHSWTDVSQRTGKCERYLLCLPRDLIYFFRRFCSLFGFCLFQSFFFYIHFVFLG